MLIFEQLPKFDRPLRWLTAVIVTGLAILVVGLWYVQVVARQRYLSDQAAQSFRTVRIPAVRGNILDRNGLILAENRPSYHASLYLEELSKQFRFSYSQVLSNESSRLQHEFKRKPTREERAQLARLARFLVASNVVQRLGLILQQDVPLSPDDFHAHYEQRLALPLPVMRDLQAAQIARLMEQTGLPLGIDLDIQPLRHYPHGSVAAHILGHLRRENTPGDGAELSFNYRLPDYVGELGVEKQFDEHLRGRAGVKSVLVNSLGYRQSENIWTPAAPGKNLVLTLDLPLQIEVEKALAEADRNSGQPARGAVIVMDAHNGDILAMASAPDFDPNHFIPSISHQEMETLSDPILRPMINKASQGLYPPGSIFKIVTGLAALEAGVAQPDLVIKSPGFVQLGSQIIKDTAPAGEYDFKRAFKLSSNTYFIQQGLKTGLDNLLRAGQRFHLGESAGLPTCQNAAGVFPSREMIRRQTLRGDPWTEGDTANLCIGQGAITVTPLQIAVLTAAVANGGKVFWPRLLQRIENSERSVTGADALYYPPRLRGELGMASQSLEIIRAAMLADVEDADGTGRRAAVAGWRIGGKTGTAEIKKGNAVIDKVTWFASFAPYEAPRYVVVVMIEGGVSGGATCAPVAGQVYRSLQRLLKDADRRGKVLAAS